ncbi:MAG: hypothetical protein IJX60_02205 [Paludibacteraceae bacterium]|nr:hypothetical protein [Paludibacteraceae bacterium]
MSLIKLEFPMREFRGKVCKHSDIIFKQMYGTKFTSRICNPYTGEPSEAQIAQKNKVATAAANIAALTPEQLADYQTAFKKAKKEGKYKTLRGYMMAQEMAKL